MLDIKTVMLALAAGYFVFGLMLFLFQLREERSRRIPFWAAGKILQGVGAFLIAGRGVFPDFLSVAVGNFCLINGFAYECWGIFRISGRLVSRSLHSGTTLAMALISLSLMPLSASNRILLVSIVLMILFALPGWVLLHYPRRESLLPAYLGWNMALLALLFAARGLWAVYIPQGTAALEATLFSGNTVHLITFSAMYFTMLTGGFGMLLLSKETTDRELQEVLKEQQAILDTLPTGLCILRERVIERCNPAMEAMFGFAPGTLTGQSVRCLYENDEIFRTYGQKIYADIEQNGRFEGEVAYIRQNGERFWAWDVGTTIFPERAQAYAVFSVTDITEQKNQQEALALQKGELEASLAKVRLAEEALRETNAYLENLINYANAPIIVWDPQFRITRFNRAFEFLTGRRGAEIIGQSLDLLFPPAQVENLMRLIRKTLTGERWEAVEIPILHRDGSVRTVLWNSATVFAPDGQTPLGTIVQGQDITERKRLEEALHHQANSDGLTGVSNRRYFLETAHREIKRALRLKHPLAIALIDVDHFKHINDSYGHAAGDRALLALAQICQKNVRSVDMFARFGGDEFAVLLPETTGRQAYEVIQRICLTLASQPLDLGHKPVALTISSGISELAGSPETLDALLERADQALYQAKAAGRNRVVIKHPAA